MSRDVPGYELLRPLGGGPVFEVWAARAAGDAAPAAVKLIRPAAANSPTALVLLKREARVGLHLRHPRLARVREAHLSELPYFVASELVPGVSLRDHLERSGRLGVRFAVWAARQAAEGLAALHREGLVHADVKPDNLRLTPAGELKLIDFAFTHRPGENRKLSGARVVLGTANYLAPELCRHPPAEGPAADLFALGLTLFECLTGRLPYPDAPTDGAIRLRRNTLPADLGDEQAYPESVVEVVRSLLRRDPRDRPTAARAVRQLVRIEIEMLRRVGARAGVRRAA